MDILAFLNRIFKIDRTKVRPNGKCREYFDNGVGLLRYEYYQRNGVLNGPFKLYSHTGVIKEQGFYKNGELDGLFKSFDKYGNLLEEKYYDSGLLDGIFSSFDLHGNLISEKNYSKGKLDGAVYEKGIGNSYYYQDEPLYESSQRIEITRPILDFIRQLTILDSKYLRQLKDFEVISMSNVQIENFIENFDVKDQKNLEILLKFKRTFFVIQFITSKDVQLAHLSSKFIYYLNYLLDWYNNMNLVSTDEQYRNKGKAPPAPNLFSRTRLQNRFISNYFESDILFQPFNDFNHLKLNFEDFKTKQLSYNNIVFGKKLEVYKTIKSKLDYRQYEDDYSAVIPIESTYKGILAEIDELLHSR